jgi:hypothetical protein
MVFPEELSVFSEGLLLPFHGITRKPDQVAFGKKWHLGSGSFGRSLELLARDDKKTKENWMKGARP